MAKQTKQRTTEKGFGLSLMDCVQFQVIPLVDEHTERLPMGVIPRLALDQADSRDILPEAVAVNLLIC
jgi:hypothetical protein